MRSDHPSSTLPTLQAYLRATHTLLFLILQIPPVVQQAALRTALLLRFTSDTLSAIPRYALPPLNSSLDEGIEASSAETLRALLNWLDELDRGWCAALKAQAWDSAACEGVDIEVEVIPPFCGRDTDSGIEMGVDKDYSPTMLSSGSPVSQTDRTRLRSLLLSGSAALEEWLEGIKPSTSSTRFPDPIIELDTYDDDEIDAGADGPDLKNALEHLGLQQAFDDLFSRTLSTMGELGGEVLSAGNEVEME